ncbi:DUF2510 domain-containing protein [Jatrophihabitans sp.]|uniref:DUF2510 domain-containing protein n=1 Tax=Jatrophihabitans sp. TaxID=1932789 RepID=UPI0030C65FAE|nr:hypothetical protein [Jatrophihabitans sp.]
MARTETAPAHGWFPDPEGTGLLRMWDGHAWTRLTKYPGRDEEIHAAPPEARSAPLPGPPGGEPGPATPRPRPRPMPVRVASRPAEQAPTFQGAQPAPATHVAQPAVAVAPEELGLAPIVRASPFSVATMVAALAFMIAAATAGLPYLVVVPVGLALRAYLVREQMAPIAVLAACSTLVIALVLA